MPAPRPDTTATPRPAGTGPPGRLATIPEHHRDPRLGTPARAAAAAVGLLAVAGAVLAAVLHAGTEIGPGHLLSAALVTAWAAAGLVVLARSREPAGVLMVAGALAGAAATLSAVLLSRHPVSTAARDVEAACRAVGVAALPAIGLHLALGWPDGRLRTRPRRAAVALAATAAVGTAAAAYAARPALPLGGALGVSAAALGVAAVGVTARCRRASPAARARLQWLIWGALVAAAIGVVVGLVHLLVHWPAQVQAVVVGGTLAVPLALGVALTARPSLRVDRLLVVTITFVGLIGLVGASYALVVLGFGSTPTSSERSLLGLSILAAALAALLWVPARQRLVDFATRRVYGERHAPDELLRTFGTRLTRALPLDELLLQLAESLKKTMGLETAEVWTRAGTDRLERAVSVPERGRAALVLGDEEAAVVARAGVSGPAWARVWLPTLVPPDRDEPLLRVAPVTNAGELLGLMVISRGDGAVGFDEDDDQAMADLARQVGLALHNVTLDSALQESIDEVRRQADELRASRARIVEAGDAQRRAIERDLHDGAQQHLVALAVGLRLARQVAETDAAQASQMLEQLSVDLQDAVQELRSLAHGIYPPLLAERGLREALTAAATRAALPTRVQADAVGRYPQPTEAAVYFCVLEALQNAGKHAGPGAEATISVREDEGALLFEVADDGAGFDAALGARGHGFVNMADRVGAIGGTVAVDSAPGRGTRLAGRIPLSS